ncbi:twin-arginine translocase subunit TatC [Sulfuriroseicoccus oceanibius]|uniref:Sec-independent protein translocase protein TatC n=1 Tax=Sulfuriroseicoccus oceanibius TaxID=2707525 RepID=A0A6B3L7G8_9BACT|nr:twin-arginine translocase subunit TatC [Sulfuriroseicoccus oceanibius]QQL45716.1 twin-arginine translocase subunit TatC [Sulfuriroseicoccus oceanibius]
MWFLKNIFRLREQAYDRRRSSHANGFSQDDEKPFLDHLEDLRKMLFKIIITVMIAMIGSFVFHKELLSIIKYPITASGVEISDAKSLPDAIKDVDWSVVKGLSDVAITLHGEEREAFIRNAIASDPVNGAIVKPAGIFRASLAIQGMEHRQQFARDVLPEGSADLELVLALLENNPDATFDDGRNLVRMTSLGPAEPFNLSLKLAFFAGIIIAFPFLFYFIAEFVMPGLTPTERRMVLPSCMIGFGLFTIGVVFAYFVVVPKALIFFTNFSEHLGVTPDWRIGYYVSFVTQLTLIFGACFELPVVVMTLVKLGLLGSRFMRDTRSYAVIIIVIVAALITPTTDALTLFLLAGPMIFLYEICIWLAVILERKQDEDPEPATQEPEDNYVTYPDDPESNFKPQSQAPSAGALVATVDHDTSDPQDNSDEEEDDENDTGFPDVPREVYYPGQAKGIIPFGGGDDEDEEDDANTGDSNDDESASDDSEDDDAESPDKTDRES